MVIKGTVAPNELGMPAPDVQTIPSNTDITEIISTGAAEGSTQFIIGPDSKHPFSVKVFDTPTRLVIDISHDPA